LNARFLTALNLRRFPRWARYALAGAVALAFLGWLYLEFGWKHTVRLADGREVTVLAVTYGTNHVFIDGPFWLQPSRRFMSASKALQLGLQVHQRSSPYPSCMVWTRWHWPGTNGPPRFASVMDRHGVEAQPVFSPEYFPSQRKPEALVAWRWENFPHVQSRNLVRFYETDARWEPVLQGEMQIRIPSGSRHRSNASPPPVRGTNGPLDVTLASLRYGEAAPINESRYRGLMSWPWTRIAFTVREGQQPSSSWSVRSLEAVGESGNHFLLPNFLELTNVSLWTLWSPVLQRAEDRIDVSFQDVLWRDEPGWKIITEFSRVKDYAPEELVAIPGIAASRTNPPFTTTLQLDTNGVIFQSVTLRGTQQIRRYVRGAYVPNFDLTLGFTSKVERVRVDLARAVDDRGRVLRFGDSQQPWKGKYTAALEIPYDSVKVDLTFAVHPSRFIEFRVRPNSDNRP